MPGIHTSKAIHQSRVTLGFMTWCVGIPSGSISEMMAVLSRRWPCPLRCPDPNLADEEGQGLMWLARKFVIPSNYGLKRVLTHRKPPDVRIWRLINQWRVGTVAQFIAVCSS